MIRIVKIKFQISGDKEGYSYLSFGQRDNLLRGDDKTSAALKSPITIYAGDVLEGGFNFVRVSFLMETTMNKNQNTWTKRYCDLK